MPRSIRSAADLPAIVPVFPLEGALLLPRALLPLNVFEPRYLAMIDHALATSRVIGIIQPALEGGGKAAADGDLPLATIGTLGRLTHFEERPDSRYVVALKGLTRFRVLEEIAAMTPFRQVRIDAAGFAADFETGRGEKDVDRRAFLKVLRDYAEFARFDLDWDDVEKMPLEDLVNSCTMASPYGPRERQALLETATLRERADMLTALAEIEMSHTAAGTTLQ
ncbi:MAG: LON peptidase substrate-binding domain-containing protein [Cucumibacter sp.]